MINHYKSIIYLCVYTCADILITFPLLIEFDNVFYYLDK